MDSASSRRMNAISKHFSLSDAGRSMPVVIGAMVTDIQAVPSSHIKRGTTILGQVRYTFGGVARNIAECMMKLGVPSFLISVVGDDMAGMALVDHWKSLGLPTDGIRRCSGTSTPVISAVFDTTGEIAAGVADTETIEKFLTQDWINNFSRTIRAASILLLDANLMPGTLDAACRLAKDANVPVWFEPVSVPKSVRATKLYKYVTYVSPNEEELVSMAKALCPSVTDITSCVKSLLEAGVQHVVLTLGSKGLVTCAWRQSKLSCLHVPALVANVVNVSGAGDCLVAGSIVALSTGSDLPASLAFGVATAKQAVQSEKNVPVKLPLASILDDANATLARFSQLDSLEKIVER